MKTKVIDFTEATCELFHPYQIFRVIHEQTKDDPCTTDCAYFDNGNCPDYKNLKITASPALSIYMTNAEIAAEMNCTPRQVSKMRKLGTLPEKYKKEKKNV